ncbi:MAG TPA: hypothetical protein VFH54_20195 [Mycobacteriales bacterium]|nr:hypothetical protein [Mycobacteriales bacterium]
MPVAAGADVSMMMGGLVVDDDVVLDQIQLAEDAAQAGERLERRAQGLLSFLGLAASVITLYDLSLLLQLRPR